MHRLRILIF